MATILLVDDEPAVRFALREVLEERGDRVVEAGSAEEALAEREEVDAVITDLRMPGHDGLWLLGQLRRREPSLPVIILTARGSERTAVAALKTGAYDYLCKPFDVDEVGAAVARAVETHGLRRTTARLEAERVLGAPIVGQSPAFTRLLDQTARVARRDVTVLVRGETGTGKELIASLLHAQSPRRSGPLVRFNCAALPSELAEAELFGHERGAFTGAEAKRLGYFGAAHGGTLVLDEIGELPLSLQPKLLRALQSGEIQPVGASAPRAVDLRVVACTNRDLRAEATAGRFREDLYYRLAVVELLVPPLRERREDIPLLAESLRRRHARRFELDDIPLPAPFVERLAAHDFPGNVRELENVILRLLALSDDGSIDAEALVTNEPPPATAATTLRARLDGHERAILEEALTRAAGNRSEAARQLGITRTTLLEKLKRLGLR